MIALETNPQFVARAISRGMGIAMPAVVNTPPISVRRKTMVQICIGDHPPIYTTEEKAREIAGDILKAARLANTDVEKLLDVVAEAFDVDAELIMSKTRVQAACSARHVFAYLLRERLGFSLSQIAKIIGDRNHGTIANSLRQAKAMMLDSFYTHRFQLIRERLCKL